MFGVDDKRSSPPPTEQPDSIRRRIRRAQWRLGLVRPEPTHAPHGRGLELHPRLPGVAGRRIEWRGHPDRAESGGGRLSGPFPCRVSNGTLVEPLHLELGSGDHHWDNAQAAAARIKDFTTGCNMVGSAISPTFSPDGSRLALVATLDWVGPPDLRAPPAPSAVFTMAYPGGTPHQVGPSFQDPRTVRWAPDGHQLAVDTMSGTYLINDDGQSELLRPDNCEMAWSPDGSQKSSARSRATSPPTAERSSVPG